IALANRCNFAQSRNSKLYTVSVGKESRRTSKRTELVEWRTCQHQGQFAVSVWLVLPTDATLPVSAR
ncbi:unnamed protein product, partial [Ceratitis capitata]